MDIEIFGIMKKFSDDDKIFQSEAQFQFDLAWEIQKNYPQFKVLLEVLTAKEIKNNKLKRYYSDIVIVDNDGNYIVIELKYKTKKAVFNDRDIELLNHGATDLGRFDYLWDVHRIELLKQNDEKIYTFNKNLKCFIKGYAIMLTNESIYWGKSKSNNNTLYRDFCISNSDHIDKDIPLKWNKVKGFSCVDNTWRNIELKFIKDYQFLWRDYSSNFKFLILEI